MQLIDFTTLNSGPVDALSRVMTMKIGTIQEMTGQGYEILVDQETRSYVLAKFFDGKLMGANSQSNAGSCDEPTVASA